MSINISIIFAKKEKTDFDRFTFPLLGRPVAYYPIYAALNTTSIDQVYLSTDSPKLLLYGSKVQGLKLIPREHSQETLTEEIKTSLEFITKNNYQEINTVTIQFANSPCITNELIFNAISFLDDNPNYDTVATCMRRGEFSPARMFSFKDRKFFQGQNIHENSDNVYFLDHRLMVTRPKNILEFNEKSIFVESVLGKNIHPIFQKEGIWDIDYPWQIPHIEKWLRQNEFTDTKSIYDKTKVRVVSDKKDKSKKDVKRVLISTVPFGEIDSKPLELLNSAANIDYEINPLNRKLKEDELCEILPEYDILIAGTEPITKKVIENSPKLKLISRVGIGLDSVDLISARENGIKVCYTPDAPSPAVAELTMAHMINLLRHIPSVDKNLRAGVWNRIQGDRLANMTIGIIGTGRVGLRVLKHLQGFSPAKILVNDLKPNPDVYKIFNAKYVEKEELYASSDIISLHIPLTQLTRNLIDTEQLKLMKPTVKIINTSRGGIVNENDLYEYLLDNKLAGAAVDAFKEEPYSGNLVELENCYFTCHMGSMTRDCRARMEIEATEEVIRYMNGEDLISSVPEEEYQNQAGK